MRHVSCRPEARVIVTMSNPSANAFTMSGSIRRVLEVRVEAHDGVARGVVDPGNHGGFVAKVSAEFQDLVRHAFRRWGVEKGPDEGLALVVRHR